MNMLKESSTTFKLQRFGRIGYRMGLMGKSIFMLALLTLCFFIGLGLVSLAQSKWNTTSVSSMKGLAASISSPFFLDMIGMEISGITGDGKPSTLSQNNIAHFLFQYVTDINPLDPRTLLAREVPGLDNENIFILRTAQATELSVYPQDYTPPTKTFIPDPEQWIQEEAASSDIAGSNQADGVQDPQADKPVADMTDNVGEDSSPQVKPVLSTQGRKVVFIYHSHNRESWIPELGGVTDPIEANDSKTNITYLGKRLAEQLEGLGIGATSSNQDYATVVQDYNWNFSYKYSLKTVKEAYATNPHLEYFFDIHRDSQKRDLTTATIGGEAYAQVYFVVGQGNPQWEKNEQFAQKIQEHLENKYPGISRGIFGKSSTSGHGEYNQSISPNSILIEVGGVENTLEESYRTIEVLARAIADIYWEAERVDAQVKVSP